MSENRVTEEAKTVKKACPTLGVMCYNAVPQIRIDVIGYLTP